jgi:ureidoacrylate peracid hydrolase
LALRWSEDHVMSKHPSSLAARPLPLDLDPTTAAVIVVDMQNNFGAPGGSWSLAGVDTTPIEALVAPIGRVLTAARRAGIPVVYLTMPAPPVPNPVGMPPELFRGTGIARWELYVRDVSTGHSTATVVTEAPGWTVAIVDGLTPEPGERVIVKQSFSGFFQTELDEVLRAADITTLLFTGCTTSICVESTLRDAVFRGYDCILLEDCVAEPIGGTLDRTNHDATVHLVEIGFGWVSDSNSVVQSLNTAALASAT